MYSIFFNAQHLISFIPFACLYSLCLSYTVKRCIWRRCKLLAHTKAKSMTYCMSYYSYHLNSFFYSAYKKIFPKHVFRNGGGLNWLLAQYETKILTVLRSLPDLSAILKIQGNIHSSYVFIPLRPYPLFSGRNGYIFAPKLNDFALWEKMWNE